MFVQARRIGAPIFASLTTVNDRGIPRFWASVWAAYLPPGIARSTLSMKLRYVDDLCNYVDRNWGEGMLDDSLSKFSVSTLCDMLEGYFVAIQNSRDLNAASEQRWRTGLQFVIDTCRKIARNQSKAEQVAEIEGHLRTLEFHTGHLYIGNRRRPEQIRSLPANVLEYLYKVLDPESPKNPFSRKNAKWRVWLLFKLLLHQGLRRSEALILPRDVVKCAFDNRRQGNRFWMNVTYNEYEDDPRYSAPSIKNSSSVRPLPVSEILALMIQEYADNYRGKADHSFLFNSQKRLPLSKEGVKWMFDTIAASLPATLQKEMEDYTESRSITPHQLRHTCAVVRLNQLLSSGVPMEQALQNLRSFFGWSRDSDMPLRYSKAVFDDRLNSVWNSQFDDHVAVLRAIPSRKK